MVNTIDILSLWCWVQIHFMKWYIKELAKPLYELWVAICHYKGIIKVNFSTWFRCVNSSYVGTILSKYIFLYQINFTIQQWHTFSMTSHIKHLQSATGVLGLVCRPLSIALACELPRNFEIASRYWSFSTRYRYGLITKSLLKYMMPLKTYFVGYYIRCAMAAAS